VHVLLGLDPDHHREADGAGALRPAGTLPGWFTDRACTDANQLPR
jgi:hypothetical protein